MHIQNFKSNKTEIKKVFNTNKNNINYNPSLYNFKNISGNGKYVRLCIIDSGLPNHKDIKVDANKVANFTNSASCYDMFGHSTAVTGIVSANGNNGIKGIAIDTDLYFAKVLLDDSGDGDLNSISKAILWSITREVDIILMAFGASSSSQEVHDSIKKAYNSGISLIAAGGNSSARTKDVDFPARYNEVFSVGYSNKIHKNEIVKVSGKTKGLILPQKEFPTTYTDSKYTTMTGSSLCASFVSGIAVLVFQNLRQKGVNIKDPQNLYNEIGQLSIS